MPNFLESPVLNLHSNANALRLFLAPYLFTNFSANCFSGCFFLLLQMLYLYSLLNFFCSLWFSVLSYGSNPQPNSPVAKTVASTVFAQTLIGNFDDFIRLLTLNDAYLFRSQFLLVPFSWFKTSLEKLSRFLLCSFSFCAVCFSTSVSNCCCFVFPAVYSFFLRLCFVFFCRLFTSS